MIVICSGYFAPLHQGHLEYLEEAFEYGNRKTNLWVATINQRSSRCFRSTRTYIVVIVNNDKQVKLKDSIPFLDEEIRCKIIECLYCVDMVELSIDEDESVALTLEKIAQKYNDDICFINAGDRQNANPKEHQICEKYKIKEVFLDLSKINSSSRILNEVGKEWLKRRQNNEQN